MTFKLGLLERARDMRPVQKFWILFDPHSIETIIQAIGASFVGDGWMPPTKTLLNQSIPSKVFPVAL